MIKYVDIVKKGSNGDQLITKTITENDINNINLIGAKAKNLETDLSSLQQHVDSLIEISDSDNLENGKGILFSGSNVLTRPVSTEHADETVVITRDVGELVFSIFPLVNAGLHLADGALLDVNGIYKEGIQEIIEKYSNTANYFCTEQEWQTSVTNFGKCAKFVYDSTNGTLRLPKLEGYLETTTDSTKSGDHTEAGLPNVTGQFANAFTSPSPALSGAFEIEVLGSVVGTSSGSNSQATHFGFDASKSNPIYGKSNTVQTDSLKVLVYIVLATAKKVPAEVTPEGSNGTNITILPSEPENQENNTAVAYPSTNKLNPITTSMGPSVLWNYSNTKDYAVGSVVVYNNRMYLCLTANGAGSTVVTPGSDPAVWSLVPIESELHAVNNLESNKANKDFSNVTDVAKVMMAKASMPSSSYVDLTLGTSGSIYTAPADGYFAFVKTCQAGDLFCYCYLANVSTNNSVRSKGIPEYANGQPTGNCEVWLPVKKSDQVYVGYTATGATQLFRFVYAQGAVSEA